jgi:hypothetical protein
MSVRSCVRISGAAVALCLAGCASEVGGMPFAFSFGGASPLGATSDGCETPQDCSERLKSLVNNPNREWIGAPQSAEDYANGTRLFAYRALQKSLTCSELKRAIEDTKVALSSLEKPPYQRAHALAGEVSRALVAEQAKRCSRTIARGKSS